MSSPIIEISLMTRYLLRGILVKHRENIGLRKSLVLISENANKIDIDRILLTVYENPSDIIFHVKQLEALTKVYKIHKNQANSQNLEKLELQILNILGYQKIDNKSIKNINSEST
ncbi:hypothetical protein [Altericista sp. CCNU0014]|uniref:hypothetical protein n=1 Tax=Altericista sp. CCNU0014 TaxID=3082949 RepID=UPI00384F7394